MKLVSMGYFSKRSIAPWVLWLIGIIMFSPVTQLFKSVLEYPFFGIGILTLRNIAALVLVVIGYWLYKNYM